MTNCERCLKPILETDRVLMRDEQIVGHAKCPRDLKSIVAELKQEEKYNIPLEQSNRICSLAWARGLPWSHSSHLKWLTPETANRVEQLLVDGDVFEAVKAINEE